MERGTDILTMQDMLTVFNVTDAYGISREAVSVPLEKKDPGAVHIAGRDLEIIVPRSFSIEEFAKTLSRELERLGYQKSEPEEE